jgi:hypothetical protein
LQKPWNDILTAGIGLVDGLDFLHLIFSHARADETRRYCLPILTAAMMLTTLAGLSASSAGPQKSPGSRGYSRHGHFGVEERVLQATYAVDEEGESFSYGLFHPAFDEERAFVVQDVAVSLVDGAEDRGL